MQHRSLESPDDWPGNLAGSSSGAVSAAVPGGVDADVKFYGVTDASRMLTTLLGSLTFREGGKGNATSGPVAFCEVHDHGFLFTVNEAKSLQARAYVKKEHFGRYELAPEHQGSQPAERLQFGINLATLVECLRILGPGGDVARLHLRYRASTACLCLTLQQGIALTECQIHTLDDELPCAPLQLESPQPVRIVLKSDALRDGLSELEHGGDAGQKDRRVAVAVTMNPLQLSLTVCGADMGCEMVYPPESLVKLDVARDVTAEYRFSLLNLVAPALRESTETCLKLSEQGLLNLMVKFASPETPDRYAFVEFYVCPLVEDDDEAFTTTQGG